MFMQTWFPIAIKDVGDQFHNNFVVRLGKASPLGYRGVNLGVTTQIQRAIRARAKARMQIVGDVPTRHETISIE